MPSSCVTERMSRIFCIRPCEIDSRFDEVVDVRSPAEYAQDHLEGAINLPVLDDLQRAHVGTIYKQTGGFAARKVGASLVSVNIARHLETHFEEKPPDYYPLVYCWRGGERSKSMATVLTAIGWRVGLVDGGYKAYRSFVMDQLREMFEVAGGGFRFHVIAGLTGSGKTWLLQRLATRGEQVIDLEALANHRGSLLGREFADPEQPGQRCFENLLFQTLRKLDKTRPIFVESESNKIGNLHVPEVLWNVIRDSPVIDIEVPLAARARYLVGAYNHFCQDPDTLLETLEPLRKIISETTMRCWEELVEAGDWQAFVEGTLTEHYDLAYRRSRARLFRPGEKMVAVSEVTEEALDAAAGEVLAAVCP